MPKITGIPSRTFRAYDPLSRLPLEEKAISSSPLTDTSFIWNNEGPQKYHKYNQASAFLQEAIRRANGLHKIQFPSFDYFQAQGRTIYNTHKEPQPRLEDTLYNRSSIPDDDFAPACKVEDELDEPEDTASNFLDITDDIGTRPPRQWSTDTCTTPRSWSPRRAQSPEIIDTFNFLAPNAQHLQPRTLFIAITENNEVEFVPERIVLAAEMQSREAECPSDVSDTPESLMDEDLLRSPTPSLTWSSSSDSSPERDPTDCWDEGTDGPTRPIIEPINYGLLTDGRSTGWAGCAGLAREESFGDLFNLCINTEDCEVF